MKDKTIIITSIIALTILELYALSIGLNGTLLKLVLIIIAGLAGWTLPQLKLMKGGK